MDVNGCSESDVVDNDADGDGVVDTYDACPSTIVGSTVDQNGCSDAQLDIDGDGVANVQLKRVRDRKGCNGSPRPDGVETDAWELKRPAGGEHGHRQLCGRVARRRADPRAVGDGRWRHRENMWQRGATHAHVRDHGASHEKGPLHVEMVQQVEALLVQRLDTERVVSRRIVDQHVLTREWEARRAM